MNLFSEEKEIFAWDDKFYLKDILTDEIDDMFNFHLSAVSFLNKTMCGNGGTTGFINYVMKSDRGCLILVPNIAIVLSKMEGYRKLVEEGKMCCVCSETPDINPDARCVISTYDQFPKLIKKLSPYGIEGGADMDSVRFWNGRVIIVDEYHKLIDESNFREICTTLTTMIPKVKCPVILMSATPHYGYISMMKEMIGNERPMNLYKVVYSGMKKYRSTLTICDEIKENKMYPLLKKMLGSEVNRGKHICIFFNNVMHIKKLALELGGDCEILCSNTKKKELMSLYSNAFSDDKRVHFMTSAYFTGHDINADVSNVIIIGSNEYSAMAYTSRDIKQILGRFRIEGGGVRLYDNYIFRLKKKIDAGDYNMNKSKYDALEYSYKNGLEWKNSDSDISVKVEHERLLDVLNSYEMWMSGESLKKSLEDYGFDVDIMSSDAINSLEDVKPAKKLPWKKVREKVMKGEPVSIYECDYIESVKVYHKEKGLTMHTEKNEVINWYKVFTTVNGAEIYGLEKEELCKVFGLEYYRIYNQRYLMECLKFIENRDYNVNDMVKGMNDYFDVRIVNMEFYKKDEYRNSWVIIPKYLFCEIGGKMVSKINNSFKENQNLDTILPPCSQNLPDIIFSYKTGYDENKHTLARSGKMSDILKNGGIPSLANTGIYRNILSDKKNRLYDFKKEHRDEFDRFKRNSQGMMSELYRRTDKDYLFTKDRVNRIECMFLDIDDSISFSEFVREYGEYAFYAYPSISNVADDWTKFRVIVPLAGTITLDGVNNLKVLKCLRCMFTRYEDHEHNLYSFINYEDFHNVVYNDGSTFDVSQELADNLMIYIDNCYEFKDKFDKKVVINELGKIEIKNDIWSLEDAENYFMNKVDPDTRDGAHHKGTFIVKMRLSQEDRSRFRDWLIEKYGSRYLSHWDSHKV